MDLASANGKLYLISTPIGNLEDITLRALNVLKNVDVIAAEDTRRTRVLLSHFDIHTRLISYHAHNEHRKTEELLEKVRAGLKLAVVSDAGTPGIADPGFLLVREAVKSGIEPEIIPGVSSLTFAAVASALPIDRFAFYGFPPVKSGRRKTFFQQIGKEDKTVFIFESPYRIGKALADIASEIGPEVSVAVIREATKMYEEVLRGTVSEIISATREKTWKGECVIGIGSMKNTISEASD
ncbi:MAG: 16S rRNA (cytidine(1402)-2'-O)-methyltransferase [Victivallaceae bacterium]